MLLPLVLLAFLVGLLRADEPLLLFPQSSVFQVIPAPLETTLYSMASNGTTAQGELMPPTLGNQFTVGISVPIAMTKKGNLVFSSGFQFNYALPWNSSQLEGTIVQARYVRQAPQLNLENIYTALEELLENYGWNSGRDCLLRMICELAENPLSRSNEDFVQEMIHLLLSPSEEADCPSRWSEAKWYEEAEQLGRSGGPGSCALAYAACAESPLESFTEIAFG